MKDYQEKVKPDRALEVSMKWERSFRDLMDEIYFPGYSEQLLNERPEDYKSEYYAFIRLYDGP